MAVVLLLDRFVRSSPFHSPERTARARSSAEQDKARSRSQVRPMPASSLKPRTTTFMRPAAQVVGVTFGGQTFRRVRLGDFRCWSASKTLTVRQTATDFIITSRRFTGKAQRRARC